MHVYKPGFDIHPIQARLVGESPWHWRAGTVCAYSGQVVVVDYDNGCGSITVWHHRDLGLSPGARVRVHERFHVLDTGAGWVSYEHRAGGLGWAADPENREAWASRVEVTVTSVREGVAYRLEALGLRLGDEEAAL